MGFTLKEVSQMVGMSTACVLKHFKRWCELNGYFPEDFLKIWYDTDSPVKRSYVIPQEFVDWLVLQKELMLLRGRRSPSYNKLKEKLGVVTLNDIARKHGVNVNFVRREWEWWCYFRGENKKKYLVEGVGYALPPEFISYIESIIEKEKARKHPISIAEAGEE